MNSNDNDLLLPPDELGNKVRAYCTKYAIPIDHFFDILNDQKVIPMLRGKGMEYDLYLSLREVLDSSVWLVEKLNISGQPGTPDKDVVVKHRRTQTELTVESKSAVRGSMTKGTSRTDVKVPHFKVKCHRSRSNLDDPLNDRYKLDAFDVLITYPSNALYKGGTVGEELELVDDPELLTILKAKYKVDTTPGLIQAAVKDWRFTRPEWIKTTHNGLECIPRTPTVLLSDDPKWQSLTHLQSELDEIVRVRADAKRKKPRS